MIKWSPSVDKGPRRKIRFSTLTLFPPFLEEESKISIPEVKPEVVQNILRSALFIRPKKQDSPSFGDYISTCKNYVVDNKSFDKNRSKEIEKRYVLCEDDCSTKILTCEKLRDTTEKETQSYREIASDEEQHDAFDPRDEDYQREDEDYEDEAGREEETRSWASDQCESSSSLSEAEEELNTTDPYLSHKLYLPYNKVQRPRFFQPTTTTTTKSPIHLPRRPRSPVRHILPGKFDLEAAQEQWDQKRRISQSRKYLEESKKRISQSIRRLSDGGADEYTLICSVILQTICERVTLTLTKEKIDVDIQVFVNVATIWALHELDILDFNTLFDAKYLQSEGSGFFDWKQQDMNDIMGTGGMRKKLMGAYRIPFNRNIFKNLHRRLPWIYMSPCHERGHTKFYPNVRERIDDKIWRRTSERREHELTHVPHLNCFHLREVLDKSYVAYRRKSKFVGAKLSPSTEKSHLIMQLLSLM